MEANRKRVQVHRLPTEDTSSLIWMKGGVITLGTRLDTLGFIPQHLYVLSHECGKKGFNINLSTNKVVNLSRDYEEQSFEWWHCRKIIATTDPKLINCINFDESCIALTDICKKKGCKRIAQPSQALIKAYCEQGGFDECDVEYIEEWFLTNGKPIPDVMRKSMEEKLPKDSLAKWNIIRRPKVDPMHNTITTHRIVEKMYSRDELVSKMRLAYYKGVEQHDYSNDFDEEEWIKENL